MENNMYFGNRIGFGLDSKSNVESPKINDKKNENYYSVLLHTGKALEEYRTNSGMGHNYATEYQHHYWSISYRIELDDEKLDIHIPLVMFNYDQEVTSGSVKFHLEEVEKVSDSLIDLAKEKATEFIQSDVGQLISTSFPGEWKITALNTLHTHPGNMDTFSGTDYKNNPDNPGIVYPLSEVEPNTPSLSSIVCHKNGVATIVRTESRLVSNDKDNNINYEQGKTYTFVRESIEEPRLLESMFKYPRRQDSYEVCNGIDYILSEELIAIIELWNKSKFEINTEHIKEENISNEKIVSRYMYGNKNKSLFNSKNKTQKKYTYKNDYFDDADVALMIDQLIDLNVYTSKSLHAMPPMSIIKLFIDEGFEKTDLGDDYYGF